MLITRAFASKLNPGKIDMHILVPEELFVFQELEIVACFFWAIGLLHMHP